ncbi:YgaB family protein [Fredinandcohnia sp. QZ13]|uniref:YgaB family protein n=1 Tax=Fredinandcohnia sp. QZ13 TaxID=3073144 RepID=UPI00285332CB|nr:YgaB family protein [Fredinandcohnia sp. QZ13]MDR4887579.1 YgaB family protein [Fredinandcohnia sp. QZ13]
MSNFNDLVGEQLKTMDKLLFIQSEIERCQELESQILELQKETDLETIQEEIKRMQEELMQIHDLFQKQTEEVIRSYQGKMHQTV